MEAQRSAVASKLRDSVLDDATAELVPNPFQCLPFVVRHLTADCEGRLGGAGPPLGGQRVGLPHLCSVPLSSKGDALEVSVYLNTTPEFIYGEDFGKIYGGEALEVWLHEPSRGLGGDAARHAATGLQVIPEYSLGFSAGWVPDRDADHPAEPCSRHKIGGVPYLEFHADDRLVLQIADLMEAEGMLHLAQLAMPAGQPDVLIRGTWPFGDHLFHLFVADEGDSRSQLPRRLVARCVWHK
ncbi:MAG: hypothetical protein VYE22_21525 [Myxococcota bacterium]|nr:hypothetical protein [Myxococcota bacterium]